MNCSSIDVRNMGYQARKAFLRQNSRILGELLKKTVAHPSQFIEHEKLSEFNISLKEFSLDSDTDAVPRFFKPFPHDLMEECFKHPQLADDLWWPPYDLDHLAYFNEPYDVARTLYEYHRYVVAQLEENAPGRRMWQIRK